MKKLILGLFPKQEDADTALFHLRDTGILSKEISIISHEDAAEKYRKLREKHDAEPGAAEAGIMLGGMAGLFASLAPIVVPGMGPILVTGPLTALLGFLMGSLTGGLIGALIDMGVPDKTAKKYTEGVKQGGALLAVVVGEKKNRKKST
jgi:uncharacterized membrane protein